MADNDTDHKIAAPRVNATDMAEQNVEIEAQIARDLEEEHKRKSRRREAKQAPQPTDKMHFHPLRPVQQVGAFAKGTVVGGLNGVAKGGRYGMWVGMAAGILGCIAVGFAGGGLLMIATGFVGAALTGMAVGGAVGVLGGGVKELHKEVCRQQGCDAKEKQQDAAKAAALPATPTQQDFREDRQTRSELNYDRYRQQDAENKRDLQTYWQDRVSAEQGGWGMGRQ